MNIAQTKDADHAPEDPLVIFRQWFEEAEEKEAEDPNAMYLATVDEYGRPSARILLLKSYDEHGFVFFTNRESRKGRSLAVNPAAAMTFYWKSMDRQVHIEGSVTPLNDSESDEYFASRPRGSRIGAWASLQSQPIENRETLLRRVKEYEAKYDGKEDIPRPPHWGGYLLKPGQIEFWQEGEFRLHHRLLYNRHSDGWEKQMLYP